MKMVAAGLVLLSLLAPGHVRAQADADPACEVARFVLADTSGYGRPLAFVSDPPSAKDRFAGYSLAEFVHRYVEPPPNTPEEAQTEAYGWYKDPPSEGLGRLFLAGDDTGLVLTACPGLRDEMAVLKIVIDPKRDVRPQRDGFFRYSYFHLGVPVVSEDGLEALVVESQQSGPLAGGGTLLHLRRTPGGPWAVVDFLGLWIS